MSRPRLLDLFSCAGGAAVGYDRSGFEVTGVDLAPQPRYPFPFIQADALEYLAEHGHEYDAIHASPPCQSYSDLAKRNGNGHLWPRLVEPVRELLGAIGRPWVIENVEGAPLENPILLCGTMFSELRVIRHRLFESDELLEAPYHVPRSEHPLVFTHDKRKGHFGMLDQDTAYVQVTGGGNATLANKRAAMGGLDWMTNNEVNEAIPPVYAEFVGAQLLARVGALR